MNPLRSCNSVELGQTKWNATKHSSSDIFFCVAKEIPSLRAVVLSSLSEIHCDSERRFESSCSDGILVVSGGGSPAVVVKRLDGSVEASRIERRLKTGESSLVIDLEATDRGDLRTVAAHKSNVKTSPSCVFRPVSIETERSMDFSTNCEVILNTSLVFYS